MTISQTAACPRSIPTTRPTLTNPSSSNKNLTRMCNSLYPNPRHPKPKRLPRRLLPINRTTIISSRTPSQLRRPKQSNPHLTSLTPSRLSPKRTKSRPSPTGCRNRSHRRLTLVLQLKKRKRSVQTLSRILIVDTGRKRTRMLLTTTPGRVSIPITRMTVRQ